MTVLELLSSRAENAPEGVALLAPGREPLSNAALLRTVRDFAAQLQAAGVTRTDVVALALPNGLDLAIALLGAMTCVVCAPLVPDQPSEALQRELDALGAGFLVRSGLAIDRVPGAHDRPLAGAALVLRTSGTTGTPKVVPLTDGQLLSSAANVAAALSLGSADRCLNVMPLFHIHGIVAALLGSLRAGGSVVCTPGFDRTAVEAWIEEFEPTWYTAVPTIHQALLDIASRRSDGGRSMWPGLRLIRSSSAALPVPVGTALEETFGVPVIEAYGMTEAAHQIASNPVPPGERKPGTVGLPAGPEVAVLDDDDNLRPAGVEGHVALRGPTISTAVLTNGWFRTGDQGRFDDDGYLTLTGRTKEMINRGGEKVAPREVDDALLSHPDVVHAVAFAIPHPRLGEEVGAAVVLRDGADVSVGQLRLFVAEELAPYKVPRRIVVVDEIPRGPSGKLVRIGLADVLGLSVADPCGARVEPVDDVERELVAIWQRVLGLDAPPSTDVEFFELGGDSLHAVELFTAIEATLGRRLDAKLLLSAPTVRAMAAEMRSPSRGADAVTVVPVQTSGSKPPLFCLLRAGSIVATRLFAEDLGPDQPVYGLWIPSMHGPPGAAGSVEHIAALGAEAIRATCGGPYALFGHSLGGTVMYDVARQLADGGATVALLVLADSVHPRLLAAQWKRRHSVRYRLRKLFSGKGPEIVSRRTRQLLRLRDSTPPVRRLPGTDAVVDLHAAVDRERRYVPRPAPYPVAILATRPFIRFAGATDLGWAEMLTGPWWADEVPGNHDTMVGEPHIHVLTARLAERLDHSATEELLA